MLRKCFLVPVLGSLALLLVADLAQAQLRVRERRMERRELRRGVVVAPVVAPSVMPADVAPTVVEESPTARISYYYTPANQGQANVAQIRVMLPDAQARVMFDETATKQAGTTRLFTTPQLTAGVVSSYRIRATFLQNGREVTQERVLNVAPGMTYVLDFTQR
jgi:uncharacterized protein (TIGR03000 family)